MMNFCIKTVPTPEAKGRDSRLLLAVLESGALLIGRSHSHRELFHDYCEKNKMDEKQQKIFAAGHVEDNRLIFEDGTQVWKRQEITEFLAARALIMYHVIED